MTKRIRQNIARCNRCNWIIESSHRHDMVRCPCGDFSVDGGTDYLRRVGLQYEELSTYYEEIPADGWTAQISEPGYYWTRWTTGHREADGLNSIVYVMKKPLPGQPTKIWMHGAEVPSELCPPNFRNVEFKRLEQQKP